MPTSSRHHTNNLSLPPLDANTLQALQSTIHESLVVISGKGLDKDGTIYSGASGIALMYLRLHVQSTALEPAPPTPPTIRLQGRPPTHPRPSRLSPLHAEHGSYVVALLHDLITKQIPPDDLFLPLQAALSASASPDAAHEVLYGTAGLLASLVSVGRLGASHPLASSDNVRALATHLIREGKAGAAQYASLYGEGLPLMWAWHGKYYLGAIHGIAGVLTILLQLPADIRDPMMNIVLPATYALLNQVDADGHLPSSLPRHSKASGELVQLCHGAPGALLLIAALRSACAGQTLPSGLEIIEARLSDRVWSEGLLSKGIPLCHGVVGNAWPWLLLSQLHPEEKKRDQYLGQALAFHLHATELPPLGDAGDYKTPENPWSLFEGLAGAMCAWSEACAILSNRLGRVKQTDVLGMPWLGGLGSCGI